MRVPVLGLGVIGAWGGGPRCGTGNGMQGGPRGNNAVGKPHQGVAATSRNSFCGHSAGPRQESCCSLSGCSSLWGCSLSGRCSSLWGCSLSASTGAAAATVTLPTSAGPRRLSVPRPLAKRRLMDVALRAEAGRRRAWPRARPPSINHLRASPVALLLPSLIYGAFSLFRVLIRLLSCLLRRSPRPLPPAPCAACPPLNLLRLLS